MILHFSSPSFHVKANVFFPYHSLASTPMLVHPKGSSRQRQGTAQSRAGWSQGAHQVISRGKLTFPNPMVTIMEEDKRPHIGAYQFKIYIATLYEQSPVKDRWILGTKLNELLCQ